MGRAALCMVAAIGAGAAPAVASAASQQTLETGLLGGGVAVDSAADVFATDISGNRVLELSAGGTQTTLPFTELNHPAGVAVDQVGDVFVADSGNNRVLELPAGTSTGDQETQRLALLSLSRAGAYGNEAEARRTGHTPLIDHGH